MKKFLKNNYKLIFMLSWMAVIFIFSATPGDESSKQSRFVLDVFIALGLNVESSAVDTATFIIRKGAHMTEYFILAALIYNYAKAWAQNRGHALKEREIALLGSFLYACTDEFHQYFVPGRTAAFRDVMIDTAGAFIFILILCIIHKFHNKAEAEKEKEAVH